MSRQERKMTVDEVMNELERQVDVTEADIERALKVWEEQVAGKYRKLLRAKPVAWQADESQG